MATFTTWAAEKTKVEDQIATLNASLLDVSMSAESRSRTKRTLDEIQNHYTWVCKQTKIEAGTHQTSKIKVADIS